MNDKSPAEALAALQGVLDALLGQDGCPWDKAQTPQTLCDYIIEESFELVDAIRSQDIPGTAEELGDVLFLLLFVATLSRKQGAFNLSEALETAAAKMVRRHPHVFSDLEIGSREELLRNWERIKRAEKEQDSGLFASLPKGLPPLLKAYRIHSKAARSGFTWETDAAMRESLLSERAEFEAAVASGDTAAMAEEFGDYLFTLTEYGRRLGLKANTCLDAANNKFLARYKAMERLARQRGLALDSLDMAAKNALWEEVKAGS
ncbi:MAG: nucleoside triphosphate pyrophosphohydrolase [Solidesulfovibrio sp.]|jgi:ATP diphosphatase|uniref:nucleoside triphosphate pyrophosphohydrolase n=1 Tax=Solidesulfovibrio sp. TaxID=2910990 RepID=UPI002B1EA816|nr:nucleoside triphosphate pyrophosphohydrolase [Solidesulfovibrio sp.]MEA4858409.1 nucleoside triphosphate pyrophosphohydrolase [Solidesulfovibrio sp.]